MKRRRSLHRFSPHRFGRQARVNEHPREIGEPSARALARIDKTSASSPHEASGEKGGARGQSSARVRSSKIAQSSPLTPTLSPERARGRGRERTYAELHCLSNFSFQRGASSAQELFERAKKLGYGALAITDECSLAGIVRAWEASKETSVKLIVGSEVQLDDGPKLVVLAADQSGYSDLCRLITAGRRRSAKGEYRLTRADAEQLGAGVRVLWIPRKFSAPSFRRKPESILIASGSRNLKYAEEKTLDSGFRRTAQAGCRSEHLRSKWPEGQAADAASNDEQRDAFANDDDAKWIKQHFPQRAWLAVELHRGPDDAAELARLQALGARHDLPLVAAGDVHMHVRRRRALQDVMTAIRLGCTVAEAGLALFPNGERHLRRIDDVVELYPPALLAETLRIAAQCTFDLGKLNYEYPHELVPAGVSHAAHLRALTYAGAARRYPQGLSETTRATIEKELALIARKRYEAFFLTVHDIVRYAREECGILCQGRGSSANSAVCYCLGITAVDPDESHLLFERFLSDERDEPPDIDVDFEHERREEVIQYVFKKYGRARAAIAATVISYRRKSALRDVGRALGLSDDALDQLSRISTRVPSGQTREAAIRERGFDPDSRVIRQLVALTEELKGFPRHLSQHVGGFVISEHPLHTLVPVENAAMPDRTIIQWDKDDLEAMKLLKVDVLALGMLTALRKCFDLLRRHDIADLELHRIPRQDADTYGMIQKADTVGVFQIESRAQMSMLPRLKPENFYDLVIEVAIVRPGPIQGNMVHPYLRRRQKIEIPDYPQSKFERATGTNNSKVEDALKRTLGVPIFQEQVMELIQVVAGFTAGEADELRRAMAAWKRKGGLEKFHDRILNGMLERGYERDYFERIFEQIKGFGEYGFPESHAASFALLAYASSWLKCHHPAAFTCALLNSQPMGFYQPSQLIQDAQRHGVRVLPVDVTVSEWDCTLEEFRSLSPRGDVAGGVGWGVGGSHAHMGLRQKQKAPPHPTLSPDDKANRGRGLRLGLRQISGISEQIAVRLVTTRAQAPFTDVADMTRRAGINAADRARLADAGALRSLSGHRHRARWDSAGAELPLPVLADAYTREAHVALRPPSLREDVMTDYATQGLSLTLHPLALIRPALARRRVVPARATTDAGNHGQRMRCAGLVTVRQHPGTAKGVTFVTLEDETGQVNVVVWRALAERQHRVLVESAVMCVDGKLEAHDGVHHLIADRLHDYSALLPEFSFASRDFH